MGLIDLFKKRKKPTINVGVIGITEAVCPYCASKLDKYPGRKKKCPHCERHIYVRTRPQDQQRILVQEDQLDAVEELWAIENGTHDQWIAKKKQIQKERARAEKLLGEGASEFDIQWGMLNSELHEHAKRGDWGLYRNTRFRMAEALRKEGRNIQALQTYLWVCYLDFNGPNNQGGLTDPSLRKLSPPFTMDLSMVAPALVQSIQKIIDAESLSITEVNQHFMHHAVGEHKRLKLPCPPEKAWSELIAHLYLSEPDA